MSEDEKKRHPKPDDFIPDKDFPIGHRHHGSVRCLAWNRNQGRQCLALAVTGTTKCRVHGGKSLKGIASPVFKDGRTSKYLSSLPIRNREQYETAISNPDLLRLKDEIALVDTRLLELTSQLNSSASSRIFEELSKEMAGFQQANMKISQAQRITDVNKRENEIAKQRAKASEHLANIQRLINEGSKEYWVWQEIAGMIESRRRLVETERKMLVDMQLLISVENVGFQIDRLLESIRKHVSDRDTLSAIQAEFIELTS